MLCEQHLEKGNIKDLQLSSISFTIWLSLPCYHIHVAVTWSLYIFHNKNSLKLTSYQHFLDTKNRILILINNRIYITSIWIEKATVLYSSVTKIYTEEVEIKKSLCTSLFNFIWIPFIFGPLYLTILC